MGHSNVRAKVRRRKVAALAAHSRQFTVKNNTIHNLGLNGKNIVINYKEIPTQRFDTPVYGKMFEIDKDGHYHLLERGFDPIPLLMNHKQPKRLIKCKNRKHSNVKSYSKSPEMIMGGKFKEYKRVSRNDFLYEKPGKDAGSFIRNFPNYPYTVKKMSKEAYMEKLVAHKLEKWEKKHPKPEDMFVEDVEKWNNERFVAEQRFRDFVISVYYKMKVFATVTKPGGPPFKEIPIGEVPGGKNAIEEATKIAKEAKAKNINILHCQVYEPNGKYRLVA